MRRLQFYDGYDYQEIVIGIASDERPWKLGHSLNEILGIHLRNVSDFEDDGLAPQVAQTGLLSPVPLPTVRFEDHETHPQCEYVFYSKDPQKIPTNTRPFRFFLLIRSANADQWPVEATLKDLAASPCVRSVVDLSQDKNLQQLLP